ncbi:hypothetical protein ANCCAN_16038 [Ancylostoma caninum]|uniref:Tyr recombinase domain-containing protein n=1 Tax=Ancylostoma caninum TaxID=29170 RepID=A0A368G439_ANCCA|nr:hypothetical protein ANCCAN_16038 [Ancylostoma caninum]
MDERVGGRIRSLLGGARAPSTVKAYKSALRSFREWQSSGPEERKRDELTSAAVFLARKSNRVGATSLATFVSALAYERFGRKPEEAMKWAILDEMVKAQRRGTAANTQEFASKQDVRTLLECLPRTSWPQWRKDRAHVLLVLLFYGLLRVSEAVALKAGEVEAGGEFWTLRIRKSKTDQESKGSSIYIGREERFDAALSRCSQRQIHGYVLATTEGRMWSPSAAASEVRKICVFAGVRSLPPHSFRRGGATSSLDSGTDVN